jgi:hypothetical protein
MPLLSLGQSQGASCSCIKNGDFYFYPSVTQKDFLIVRNHLIQKEINVNTGDTSFWKVSWSDLCIFNLKFLRRSQSMSDEEKLFYTSRKTIIGSIENYQKLLCF